MIALILVFISSTACRRLSMRLLLQDLFDAFEYGGPQYFDANLIGSIQLDGRLKSPRKGMKICCVKMCGMPSFGRRPNDILWIPQGWVICEQSISSMLVYGVRESFVVKSDRAKRKRSSSIAAGTLLQGPCKDAGSPDVLLILRLWKWDQVQWDSTKLPGFAMDIG